MHILCGSIDKLFLEICKASRLDKLPILSGNSDISQLVTFKISRLNNSSILFGRYRRLLSVIINHSSVSIEVIEDGKYCASESSMLKF